MKSEPKTPQEIVANAEETLRAIQKLKECEEFTGFYTRFLEARRDGHDREALHTANLTLEEREVRRRIGREYDDLLGSLDTAAAMAKKAIAQKGRL